MPIATLPRVVKLNGSTGPLEHRKTVNFAGAKQRRLRKAQHPILQLQKIWIIQGMRSLGRFKVFVKEKANQRRWNALIGFSDRS